MTPVKHDLGWAVFLCVLSFTAELLHSVDWIWAGLLVAAAYYFGRYIGDRDRR